MTYTEIGKIMDTNKSSIQSLADKRQTSVPAEEDAPMIGEVTMILDTLGTEISEALISIENLKARLYFILPPELNNEDINCIKDNIEQREISCPLGKELEFYYHRISEITAVIHYLLKNIKS